VDALLENGFSGPTTLEVAGTESVQKSIERLRGWTR
jgi:hypothetical protein